MAAAAPASPSRARRGADLRYFGAVAVTVAAILSQYYAPQLLPFLRPVYSTGVGDLFVVYGIPILAFALLVGAGPLRAWRANLGQAAVEGLKWYALLTLLALLVSFVLIAIYLAIDPNIVNLLNRPNPALQNAASDPWFYVGFSFVIGAVEETIFRGWIFGYWRERTEHPWLFYGVGSSVLFAAVHLYYGTTYGPASPVIFATLFLLGLAFAIVVRRSGGNLVIVALLHGAHDAAGFLSLISTSWAFLLEYGLVAVGVIVAVVVEVRARSVAPPPPPFSPYPPGGPSGPTLSTLPWASPYEVPPPPPPWPVPPPPTEPPSAPVER